jgi:Carotenoid biosynthesis protein
MELTALALGTVAMRPYVFLFLLAYLWTAVRALGVAHTLLFTALTWGVAFTAEASSIRTGVPFGWYRYLEATQGQELWIAGVPIMDSLSFVDIRLPYAPAAGRLPVCRGSKLAQGAHLVRICGGICPEGGDLLRVWASHASLRDCRTSAIILSRQIAGSAPPVFEVVHRRPRCREIFWKPLVSAISD